MCCYQHSKQVRFNPRTHTGCDRATPAGYALRGSFNPRTHTGCDIGDNMIARVNSGVSIHAPTRGATLFSVLMVPPPYIVSIHAPTRGATLPQSQRKNCTLFQSTHPHGVRPVSEQVNVGSSKFQSTHPHGVRPTFCSVHLPAILVSIHAPTRGATPVKFVLHGFLLVSIHAPTRGATPRYHCYSPGKSFQSTHPHGVRRLDW